MKERRKHKRYPVSYPIEQDRQKRECALTLVDVSKGGVAFNSQQELRENEKIDLKIFLKRRMFSVAAMVVHAKKLQDDLYNAGAVFLETPEDFHDILEKEIEEITQHHRESNLYRRRNLTFQKASEEYLGHKK